MKEIIPNLTDGNKILMEKLLAAGHIEYKYAKRPRIVLRRSEGHSAQEIAGNYAAGRSTINAIVNRYNQRGLESLLRDKTHKHGTTPVSAELKNKICQTTCHEKPKTSAGCTATHWSTRCLAKKFGVSRTNRAYYFA
jgi:transposase